MTEELNPDDVETDDRLMDSERETIVRFAADEGQAHVFSEEAGVCRRLLMHPEFEANVSRCRERNGAIESVTGTLPIGCLSVGLTPRSESGHADVVTRRVLSE